MGEQMSELLSDAEIIAISANTTNEDGDRPTEADLVLILEWARKVKIDYLILTAVIRGDALVFWGGDQPHFQRALTVQ